MPAVASIIFKYEVPSSKVTMYKQTLNNFHNILSNMYNNLERKIRADIAFKERFEREKFMPRYYRIRPIVFREETEEFLKKMNERLRRYREFRDDIKSIRDDMDYYRKIFLLI